VDSDVFGRVASRESACWLNLNRCVAFAACSLAPWGYEASALRAGWTGSFRRERIRGEMRGWRKTCVPMILSTAVGCVSRSTAFFAGDTSVRWRWRPLATFEVVGPECGARDPVDNAEHRCCGRCPDSNTEVDAYLGGDQPVARGGCCAENIQSPKPSAIR